MKKAALLVVIGLSLLAIIAALLIGRSHTPSTTPDPGWIWVLAIPTVSIILGLMSKKKDSGHGHGHGHHHSQWWESVLSPTGIAVITLIVGAVMTGLGVFPLAPATIAAMVSILFRAIASKQWPAEEHDSHSHGPDVMGIVSVTIILLSILVIVGFLRVVFESPPSAQQPLTATIVLQERGVAGWYPTARTHRPRIEDDGTVVLDIATIPDCFYRFKVGADGTGTGQWSDDKGHHGDLAILSVHTEGNEKIYEGKYFDEVDRSGRPIQNLPSSPSRLHEGIRFIITDRSPQAR